MLILGLLYIVLRTPYERSHQVVVEAAYCLRQAIATATRAKKHHVIRFPSRVAHCFSYCSQLFVRLVPKYFVQAAVLRRVQQSATSVGQTLSNQRWPALLSRIAPHLRFNSTPYFNRCEDNLPPNEYLTGEVQNDAYDRVCAGCLPWIECDDCIISDSNLDTTCSKTLEHTSANERGCTLETLLIENACWRATVKHSTIVACYNNDACLGGQTVAGNVRYGSYKGPCE